MKFIVDKFKPKHFGKRKYEYRIFGQPLLKVQKEKDL